MERYLYVLREMIIIALEFLVKSAAITLALVVILTMVIFQDITQIREVFLYAVLFYVVMILMALSEVIEKKM